MKCQTLFSLKINFKKYHKMLSAAVVVATFRVHHSFRDEWCLNVFSYFSICCNMLLVLMRMSQRDSSNEYPEQYVFMQK